MTSLPLNSSPSTSNHAVTATRPQSANHLVGPPLSSFSHKMVAQRYLRSLSEALSPSREASPSSTEYPHGEGSSRCITRNDLPQSVRGPLCNAQLRALRSGVSPSWHHDDVHVILPMHEVFISAGKDGRAIASRLDRDTLEAQPIHPLHETGVLFSGASTADGHAAISDEAWVTAGASVGDYFALGRRDGTIFKGELQQNREGVRTIQRFWSHPKYHSQKACWQVFPEGPRIKSQGTSASEDPNSRRIYGIALLEGSEQRPPAMIVACGRLLWCTSAGGHTPSVYNIDELLSGDHSHLERILTLQGVQQPPDFSKGSIMALTQTQAFWLEARPTANPLQLHAAGQTSLETHHTSAHWVISESAPYGVLGQSRTGHLTYVEWEPSGQGIQSEWTGLSDDESVGTSWSIDHLSNDLFISGHERSLIRLWDIRSGSPELDLKLPFGRVSSVAAHREAMQVLSCNADDHCRNFGSAGTSMTVWDIRKNDRPIRTGATPNPAEAPDSFDSENLIFDLED